MARAAHYWSSQTLAILLIANCNCAELSLPFRSTCRLSVHLLLPRSARKADAHSLARYYARG